MLRLENNNERRNIIFIYIYFCSLLLLSFLIYSSFEKNKCYLQSAILRFVLSPIKGNKTQQFIFIFAVVEMQLVRTGVTICCNCHNV